MKRILPLVFGIFVMVFMLFAVGNTQMVNATVTEIPSGGSLSTYINSASSGDTLKLTTDITANNIVLTKSITIDLNGHTINCNNNRFITINQGGNLTITDSNPESDAKIFKVGSTGRWDIHNSGSGTLYINLNTIPTDGQLVSVKGGLIFNAAKSDTDGGCVYINGGTFTMAGGSIVGCQANNGGGVYVNRGTFNLNGGAILGCYAKFYGGGVLNHGTISMTGGTIMGNYAGQEGGGIDNYNAFSPTCTITGGSISYNKAVANGGGIYNGANAATRISNHAVVSGNSAGNDGGGILNNGTVEITEASIDHNIATQQGGGIAIYNGTVTLISSTVNYNDATNGGGVYYPSNTNATFTVGGETEIENNSSTYYVKPKYPYAFNVYLGTGKYITVDSNTPLTGNAVIRIYPQAFYDYISQSYNGKFNQNARYKITTTCGYAKYFTCDTTSERQMSSCWTTISDNGYVELVNNYKPSSDLTIYCETADGGRFTSAGVAMSFSYAQTGNTQLILQKDITITSTVNVNENKTLSIKLNGKNLILGNTDSSKSLTMFNVNANATLTIKTSSQYDSNIIGRTDSNSPGYGTIAELATGSQVTILHCKIKYIHNGSAFKVNGGALTLTDCTVDGCKATNGGAFYVNGGTLTVNDYSKIKSCQATNNGGAIYVKSGTVNLNCGPYGGGIAECTAENGGGIYNEGGDVSLESYPVIGCTASKNGGGIFNNGTLEISSSSINSNTATNNDGGGIYNASQATITNSTLASNKAEDGAGIYNLNNTLTATNSTFYQNTATNFGGGICTSSGTVKLISCCINENSAKAAGGGGVYVSGTIVSFELEGSVRIFDNGATNVYLSSGKTIISNLSDDANVYVSLESFSTNKDIVAAAENKGTNQQNFYKSDVPGYMASAVRDTSVQKDKIYFVLIAATLVPGTNSLSLSSAISDATTGTTIKLTADITANGLSFSGKTITIDLNGFKIDCGGSRFITIGNGGILILKDSNPNVTGKIFKVGDNQLWGINNESLTNVSSYTIKAAIPTKGESLSVPGGVIYNAKVGGNDGNGGCILVNNGGTFTMEGGSIVGCQACYGAGVYVHNGGSFGMEDGAILGCYAEYGGGGVLNHGTIDMTGGTIMGNYAGCTKDSKQHGEGGGIINYQGSSARCTISGGSIKYNKVLMNGGGIYNGGNNDNNTGSATTTITNAEIRGNHAGNDGGGILNNGTLDINAGTRIDYNSAGKKGGGICNYNGSTSLTDCTIYETKDGATEGGRGVYTYTDITVAGRVIINGLFLDTGKYINISETKPLTYGSNIKVMTKSNAGDRLTAVGKCACANYIDPDADNTWKIICDNNYIELKNSYSNDICCQTTDGALFTSIGWNTAISYAQNKNVLLTLTENASVSTETTVTKNLTIDLNGKSILFNNQNSFTLFTVTAGELKITNSIGYPSSIGGPSLDSKQVCQPGTLAKVSNGATLTIENCTIENIDNSENTESAIEVSTGGTLTISNCTLKNCKAKSGGALYVSGSDAKATIENCTITNNTATTHGAFAFVCYAKSNSEDVNSRTYPTAKIIIKNTNLNNNTSTNESGIIYLYGAVSATFENCIFNENSDTTSTGSAVVVNGFGGVWNPDVTISGCSINRCAATNGAGICIYVGSINIVNTYILNNNATNEGGGIFNQGGTVNIWGGSISGNTATDGGGILNKGTLNIKNTTIYNNKATFNGIETKDGSNNFTKGGGICSYNGTVTITEGSIGNVIEGEDGKSQSYTNAGNLAHKGAGIYNGSNSTLTINRTLIFANTANAEGGGIFIEGGTGSGNTTINNAIINGNTASSHGGGVYVGAKTSTSNPTLELVGEVKIYDNSSDNVYLSTGETITSNLSGSAKIYITLQSNNGCIATATKQGKYYESDSINYVVVEIDSVVSLVLDSTVIINDSTTSTLKQIIESAKSYTTIKLDKDITLDGSIALTNNITIQLNLNGHKIDCNGQRFITISAGKLVISDGDPNTTHNFVLGNNGRWELSSNGSATVETVNKVLNSFPTSGNTYAVYGGVIYNANVGGTDGNGGCILVNNGGTFTMEGGSIVGCQACNGAGVYVDKGGSFRMEDGAIFGCYATSLGGGVLNHGTFSMISGSISGNRAGNEGGGIMNYYNENNPLCTISGGYISYNEAVNNGGGLYIFSTANIENATICGNKAKQGAGILNNGSAKITKSTISNNTADTNGGGICIFNGTVSLTDVTITGNTAKTGGGIFLGPNSGASTPPVLDFIGEVKIYNNNTGNVYLSNGKTIASSQLSGDANVGVTLESTTGDIATSAPANQAQYFSSDNARYGVGMNNDTVRIVDDGSSAKSMTLTETIGANSYVDVKTILGGDNWATTYPNAYIELIYNANTESYSKERTTIKYILREIDPANNGMFKFTCTMTPAQMNDTFTICLYTGGTDNRLLYKNDDTIAAWCERVIAEYGSNGEKANFVALCKSILDYGKAAQEQFNYNAGSNPSYYNDLSSYDATNDLNTVTVFNRGDTKISDVSFTGLTFVSLSDSSLMIYYTGNIESVTSDKFSARLCTIGNEKCIEVYGIPTVKLAEEIAITVTSGTQTEIIKTSGLSYAKLVLSNASSFDIKTVNLCKALVIYNKLANAYFNQPSLSEEIK